MGDAMGTAQSQKAASVGGRRRAIVLHPHDDVATALDDLPAGTTLTVGYGQGEACVTLLEDIAFGHKFALREIAAGQAVHKYGMPIGQALRDIRAGEWVHVHNCRSHRWGYYNDLYGVNA